MSTETQAVNRPLCGHTIRFKDGHTERILFLESSGDIAIYRDNDTDENTGVYSVPCDSLHATNDPNVWECDGSRETVHPKVKLTEGLVSVSVNRGYTWQGMTEERDALRTQVETLQAELADAKADALAAKARLQAARARLDAVQERQAEIALDQARNESRLRRLFRLFGARQ